MRAVEDDHVDRPGVQARRRVEPTGTNRPIGLIALVIRVRTGSAAAKAGEADNTVINRPAADAATNMLAEPDTRRRSTRDGQSEHTCDAPVWWPERRAQNPIPSRTRPLNTPAPMVLCLKARESRSPPDLPIARQTFPHHEHRSGPGHTARSHRAGAPGPAAHACGSSADTWRGVEQPGSSSGS